MAGDLRTKIVGHYRFSDQEYDNSIQGPAPDAWGHGLGDPEPRSSFIVFNKALFYLCSYPKCGRTWLRFILANYFNLHFNLKMDIHLRSMFTILPNDRAGSGKGPESYIHADDTRFPLILSSHERFHQEAFAGTGTVFLFRSIPDVVVSDFFQMSRFLGEYEEDLKAYIHDSKGGLERYLRYLNEWSSNIDRKRTKILTYEMLHQNAQKVTTEVLYFFKLPVDDTWDVNRFSIIAQTSGLPVQLK